jgi:hypothetical protein
MPAFSYVRGGESVCFRVPSVPVTPMSATHSCPCLPSSTLPIIWCIFMTCYFISKYFSISVLSLKEKDSSLKQNHNIFFFFFSTGLELRAYTLSHSTSPFCDRLFQVRVSQTICLGLSSNLDPLDLCLLSI